MSIIYMLFALLFLQYYLFVASIFPFTYGLIPFWNVCNGYATTVDLHLLVEDNGVSFLAELARKDTFWGRERGRRRHIINLISCWNSQ